MLESLLDSVEFPALIFDSVSKVIVAVNAGAATHFGLAAESLVGQPVAGLLTPEDRVRFAYEEAGGSVDESAANSPLPAGHRYGLRVMVESDTWNGRPAGLAVLCDPGDGGPYWGHTVSLGQGRVAAAVIETALEAVVVVDGRGVIQSTNSASDALFGYPHHELIGQRVEKLMPRSVALRHGDFIAGAVDRGIAQPGRPRLFRVLHRDGHELEAAVSLTELPGDPVMFCAVLRDVTGDRLEQLRLEQLALTDQITGLPNRRSFEDWWAESEWLTAPAAVLLLELQRVSVLVEGFGREIADEVLAVVGGRLQRAAAGAGARLARSDSGRFLVLAPNHPMVRAQELAKALHDAVGDEVEAGGIVFQPVLNIGIAIRKGAIGTSASAIAEASVALARLNKMGVALTAFGDSSAQSRAALELTMEAALRSALRTGNLRAGMQPAYRMADTHIVGAELLARWTWDDHEIPPAMFVGLAERTGLIDELSRQMRQHAFGDLPQFLAAAEGGPWRTWVNISPREMIEASFTGRLLNELDAAGIDPNRVGLEVTETALLANPKTARNTLAELRRSGLAIALDDFGTGFSSLSLLRDIEVDVVKIDRSFISALPADTRVAAIVSGIIATVTAMGAEVIAEGVETTQQFEWLEEAECHTAQGFLFSGVISSGQLLELMQPNPPRA